MLVRGTISRIFSYYFTSPWCKDEVLRAFREFVGEKVSKTVAMDTIGVENEGYFNEWFLYDYMRADGRTTLHHFVHTNPLGLAKQEMVFYSTLLETNHYGLFKIVSVQKMIGMRLEDIQTRKRYDVREMSATLQVQPKQILFGRVANAGIHWELVGGDTYAVAGDIHSLLKDEFGSIKKLTPKDAYNLLKLHGEKSIGFQP
ncbi:MAG: hypothetical protein AAB682_01455 [Patescibacteria group bacterium]